MRVVWAAVVATAFTLGAIQVGAAPDASATGRSGGSRIHQKSTPQAQPKSAGSCWQELFGNASVCVAVRGTGLHLDTLGAGESYESFKHRGCATPSLYANGRKFRVGSRTCGLGLVHQNFEMNINMPNNTRLCLGWSDIGHRACLTIHR